MRAICLRRCKNDEVNGKPIVSLPKKEIEIIDIEFTREEKLVYDAYLSRAREIITKYV